MISSFHNSIHPLEIENSKMACGCPWQDNKKAITWQVIKNNHTCSALSLNLGNALHFVKIQLHDYLR